MLPQRLNFIWSRDPQEAYENPYEYEAQEQCLRESEVLLNHLFNHLMKVNRRFCRDDITTEKAVWMLHVDACDSLRDIVQLINLKKHRPAGKLFRDVIETVDCAKYFHRDPLKSIKALKEWYGNESPKHGEIRRWMDSQKLGILSELKEEYNSISKFTHRTYRVLAYNYILGADNILSYEGEYKHSSLPHPVSLCCALLTNYIKVFADSMLFCCLVSAIEMTDIWEVSIEEEPEKRRFITPQEIYMEYLNSKDR